VKTQRSKYIHRTLFPCSYGLLESPIHAWHIRYFPSPTEALFEEENTVAFSPVSTLFKPSPQPRCQKLPERARGGRASGQSRVFPMSE